MARKKYYYYVLVFTNEGPKYVISIECSTNVAHWDITESPVDFSKDFAYDMVRGLTWNGHSAVVVTSLWEITSQPYAYMEYQIKWESRDYDNEDNE